MCMQFDQEPLHKTDNNNTAMDIHSDLIKLKKVEFLLCLHQNLLSAHVCKICPLFWYNNVAAQGNEIFSNSSEYLVKSFSTTGEWHEQFGIYYILECVLTSYFSKEAVSVGLCTENSKQKANVQKIKLQKLHKFHSKTYLQSSMNKAHFVFQFSVSASYTRYLPDTPSLFGWCFLIQAASFAGKMFTRSVNSENCWWSDQLYVIVWQKCKTEWSGGGMVTLCTTKHITNKKVTTQGSCVLNFLGGFL